MTSCRQNMRQVGDTFLSGDSAIKTYIIQVPTYLLPVLLQHF